MVLDPTTRFPSATVTVLRHGYATDSKDTPLLSTGISTLTTIARRIRSGPQTHRLTNAFRLTQQQLGPKNPAVKQMKSKLPAIIPSLALPPGHHVRNLPDDIPHTGLYVFDIDQEMTQDLIPSVLQDLADCENTLLAARSTSGTALYVILAGPLAKTPLHHKLLWNAIHKALPEHIRRHAAPSQNNINRTRILAHDPDCYLSPNAVPIDAEIQELPKHRNQVRRNTAAPTAPGQPPQPDISHTIIQSISEAHRHTAIVRSALAALPQHHADTYGTWITIAYRLAGGQHIHGAAFQGKTLFAEFSRRSARYSPGDEDSFDYAYLHWDGRATTAGILAEARQSGWQPPHHMLGHTAIPDEMNAILIQPQQHSPSPR